MATFLSVAGCLLLALGGWQIYEAVNLDILVEGVANLQAMQIQMATLIFGCAMFCSGSVFLTGSAITHYLTRPSDQA